MEHEHEVVRVKGVDARPRTVHSLPTAAPTSTNAGAPVEPDGPLEPALAPAGAAEVENSWNQVLKGVVAEQSKTALLVAGGLGALAMILFFGVMLIFSGAPAAFAAGAGRGLAAAAAFVADLRPAVQLALLGISTVTAVVVAVRRHTKRRTGPDTGHSSGGPGCQGGCSCSDPEQVGTAQVV